MHHDDHLFRTPMHRLLVGLGLFGLPLVAIPPISGAFEAATRVVGVATVVDGDTLEIRGERIRLHAIDAPESDQLCRRSDGAVWPCGRRAAFALADKIGRGTVTCHGRDTDRYGRLVAVCFHQGQDLNGWMVLNGWAVAYRRFGQDYVREEDGARTARRGVWSGTFDMPWDWRRAR